MEIMGKEIISINSGKIEQIDEYYRYTVIFNKGIEIGKENLECEVSPNYNNSNSYVEAEIKLRKYVRDIKLQLLRERRFELEIYIDGMAQKCMAISIGKNSIHVMDKNGYTFEVERINGLWKKNQNWLAKVDPKHQTDFQRGFMQACLFLYNEYRFRKEFQYDDEITAENIIRYMLELPLSKINMLADNPLIDERLI